MRYRNLTRKALLMKALLGIFLSAAAFAQSPPSVGIFEDHADVGSVLHPGSAQYDPTTKTYRLSGSGANMWFAEDDFHFVWKKVSGDVSLAADISLPGTGGDPHRKAVLMIRQSLDPGAAYAGAARHGDGLTSLQFRAADGQVTHEIESNVSAPTRLRIEKRGDAFYLWIAANDGPLQFAGGSMDVPLKSPFYIGIGVCAHNKDAEQQALFSNVDLQTGVPSRGALHLYSTVETIAVASTDARVAQVQPGQLNSPGWTTDGPTSPPAQPDTPPSVEIPPDDFHNGFLQPSPDGKSVAFLSWQKSAALSMNQTVVLRVITLADHKVKPLATFTGGEGSFKAPAWSPDSKKLIFVSYQMVL
jgi:TolB protein